MIGLQPIHEGWTPSGSTMNDIKAMFVEHMVVPIRCGGSGYLPNGQQYYIFHGNKITEEQFHALQGLNSKSLKAKIAEYYREGILVEKTGPVV